MGVCGKGLCIGVLLWGLAAPAVIAAQVPDPELVWHTLHTEHFDVSYHEPLDALAQRLAISAERANELLSRALGYTSSERTLLVLTDQGDDANGLAGVVPRNEIQLYAAAPDDISSVGDYDDWITTLVTHEHTHILHLDQIGGLPAIINVLLGKTVSPNSVQPRWFIEGLAAYEESARTSGGRVRSSLFDMMLRMDVLQERWPTLAQVSNDPVRWPHGELRYLYGARFLAFIAERHGEKALAQMGREYGRQAIPYGLNRIARRATGRSVVELYDDFHAAMRERYGLQRDAIDAAVRVEGSPLTAFADITRSPRFLRDGRLLYFASNGLRSAGLRVVGGALLARSAGEATPAVHPDGDRVIYGQVAPYRDLYSFHDLFELDLRSGESTRLTTGLRASQPDVAPSGREIAFVTQASGTSSLEVAKLDDIEGTRHVLLRSAAYEQVFTPRYSPDGRRIAVSVWRAGGYRDIVLVDTQTGELRALTHDRAQDSGPAWSPDGTRVYFASDRSGVANIHVFELQSGVVQQLTNVLSGAYQPEISRDGKRLVYVGYDSRGYGLQQLDLGAVTPRTAPPHRDLRPAPTQLPTRPPLAVHDYNPLATLPPRNYRLELQDRGLGTELGVDVRGSDVAGFHSYELHCTLPLSPADPSVSLRYAYGRTPLSPTLRVFRDVTARYDLVVGGVRRRWIAESHGANVAVSYRFPAVLSSQLLDFDYSLVHLGKTDAFGGALDPNDPPPELPDTGFIPSVGFGYRYSDAERQAYDISPSSGGDFGMRVDVTDPIMGRSIHSVALRFNARRFLHMPWLSRHVLGMHYEGGIAGGDRGRVGNFAIGGFPEDSTFPSLYDVAVFGALPSLSGDALRGYPPGFRSGSQYHLLQLEYRFPLFAPEWGAYTLPYYLRQLYADVFSDIGNAFSAQADLSDCLVGVGAELFASLQLSYRMSMTIRIGIARGVSNGGETQFYLHLGTPF